jgi:hypothetical protein
MVLSSITNEGGSLPASKHSLKGSHEGSVIILDDSDSDSSDSRKHLKSAPFEDGFIPSGRPAVKDYSAVVRCRLRDAAFIYENWVLSNNGFPDRELQYTWAREAWGHASGDALELFKLSDRMFKLVSYVIF